MNPPEDAEAILFALMLELPGDGIVRYSTLRRYVDRKDMNYVLLDTPRAALWTHLFDGLKRLGFRPMTPGTLGDWRKA